MSKKGRMRQIQIPKQKMQQIPIATNLLDLMQDGKEFESLVANKIAAVNAIGEIRNSLQEIKAIRNRPAICYLANVVNTGIKVSTAIDNNDDLPFSEMISGVPESEKSIDVILVTPGGSAQQVAKFVTKLRPRFDRVSFIIPYMAMSAGTIFAMSGDEIVMGENSYIGPIDPQVPNKDGHYVPAQAILTVIDDIRQRGEALLANGGRPSWTDLQILKQIDAKEIGNAINASAYSAELVEGYLYNYKFNHWTQHKNGNQVTDAEKRRRANEIARMLCSHAQWKTHSRGITRDVAWRECKIKITHTESLENLDRAIRRFWALTYWIFENTPIYKAFVSDNYCIFRNDANLMMRAPQ